MTTKTLSVYDALIEISRINDKISNVFNGFKDNNLFITYGIENSKTLCGIDRDKCLNVLKSNYDSINHLISNLYEYKAKVALSNATTKITIGNKEYTVAEAIQRKANIGNEVKFINRIESQLSRALSEITKHNSQVEESLSDYIQKVRTESSTVEEINKLSDYYRSANMYVLVDPNKLSGNFVQEKQNELTEFIDTVDSKITTSNCSTMITVELKD